jgi:hypothetical protein
MPKLRKYQYHKDGTLPEVTKDYIFVFGANLRGQHGAGAAVVAKEKFGAEFGIGMGLTGNSYAIPTKDRWMRSLSLVEIKHYINVFKNFTHNRPDSKFWVTAVGCGLAGFHMSQIAPLFIDANTNCNFPDNWKNYLK